MKIYCSRRNLTINDIIGKDLWFKADFEIDSHSAFSGYVKLTHEDNYYLYGQSISSSIIENYVFDNNREEFKNSVANSKFRASFLKCFYLEPFISAINSREFLSTDELLGLG